jgi:spore maturation protein CgeB
VNYVNYIKKKKEKEKEKEKGKRKIIKNYKYTYRICHLENTMRRNMAV